MIVATLGLVPFAATAALAQSPPRPPGEVPYLIQPPGTAAPFGSLSPAPLPMAPPAAPAAAQPAPAPAPAAAPPAAAPKSLSEADTLKQRDQELQALRAEQRRTLETEARLKREIESIGDDRRKFNQELLDAAARVRTVEEAIAKTEERLRPLDARNEALRKSLDGRRHLIAEVLGALQRIGRHPPPAIMVKPEDALQSVRSAMMLGAVLPEMRREVDVLIADLVELVGLRRTIADEREGLDRDLLAIAEDRLRLSIMTDQRQKQQADVETALASERQRMTMLARQADNLRDLIGKLEQSLDAANRARNAGRPGDERRDGRPDLAALKDPGRLTPAVAFASTRGTLSLPVNGVRIKEFGGADGLGGTERGLSIAARPGAQVTAPCDGWVVYAGTFRNYGQLLILNAGGGYHVLLAGMDRISVDLGQFVVTGEPVAVMGGRVATPAALAIGSGQPVLYVEFRKDGTPVDPGPWWAASEVEKVRG
jgi:murein hydrolase activator